VTLFCLVSCHFFPNIDEINDTFVVYQQKKSEDEKIQVILVLLQSLSNPDNLEEDRLVHYAMKKLEKIYMEDNDSSILIAMDKTEIDAGFANYVCDFYYKVKEENKFINRYKNDKFFPYIERCIGLSFSREEIPYKIMQSK